MTIIEKRICVDHEYLNRDINSYIFQKIKDVTLNECTKEFGYILSIKKLVKIKDNYIILLENSLQEKNDYIDKFEIKIDKNIPIPLGEKMTIIAEEIKEKDIKAKDHRIKQLEKICLSKQRRVEYPDRNVIYMITTNDHLQRRTYIIGKAKNLTNRLSTYNKTCDHTVIHHRECKNEEDMNTAETIILHKLRDYREQANRDRFILPQDKEEIFFTTLIDESIRFLD